MQACGLAGIDLDLAMRSFHAASAASLRGGASLEVHRWLDELRGGASVADIARRAGRSRYAVSRWLKGQTEPRLPDFLLLVHAITDRVSDLVGQLVEIESVPGLLQTHRLRNAAKRLAFDAPWTEAILRVMETQQYRAFATHPEGYLQARLGLSAEEERSALELAEQAGVLARERDRYRELTPLSVDMAAPRQDIDRLKAHWTRVALERLESPRQGDWLGYNVVSVSQQDLERIRQLLRQTFRELRTLAAASEPVETAALINLQLVSWD